MHDALVELLKFLHLGTIPKLFSRDDIYRKLLNEFKSKISPAVTEAILKSAQKKTDKSEQYALIGKFRKGITPAGFKVPELDPWGRRVSNLFNLFTVEDKTLLLNEAVLLTQRRYVVGR